MQRVINITEAELEQMKAHSHTIIYEGHYPIEASWVAWLRRTLGDEVADIRAKEGPMPFKVVDTLSTRFTFEQD